MNSNNTNSTDNTLSLVFKIDEESKPTVANISDYQNSPFFMPISKGVDLVKNIIASNKKDPQRCNEEKSQKEDSITTPIRNNVIAFLGERGSGKTSCMMSVVNVLRDSNDPSGDSYRNSIQVFDVIDPSFFDSTHNITDIFIGEFYRKYEELTKKFNQLSDKKRDQLKTLQSEFKIVKKALQYLDSSRSDQPLDDIDALSRLSSGLELSRSLSRLVNCYLEYIGKKTLLVVIDDLDLNIDASYRMMEEIRKYLVLPNVIILLGAKLNQLKLGISYSYTKYRKEDLLYRYEIDEMALKYLEKCIPVPNRIFMPDPENIIHSKLKVESSEGVSESFPSVAFAVTSLIYQKTRYLFYNHDGIPSMIIPRNLREIRMLVTSLIKRKDPNAGDNSIHIDNKSFFKKYFQSQWIPTLDSDYQDFAKGLMEEPDISKINKNTIKFLESASVDFKNWLAISEDSGEDYSSSALLRRRLRDITDAANANVNITVGDVMATASAIGEIENSHKMGRLVFFIQTFYSMKLYELYDEMTDPENLNDNGIVEKEETPQTIPVLKNAKNIVMPEYLTLAAGDFFLLIGDSFIPFSRTKMSREIRLIDGEVLNENIRLLISELYDTNKKEFKSASKMQIARLKIIEFFVLCSRRSLNMRKADYSLTKPDTWRQSLDASYITKLGTTKNIIFEITAPFFNMVYPKYAYQRFHPNLYDLASKCQGSLLNSILKDGKRNENRNDFADLMSRICIRNMEVLADLNKWLSAKKDNLRAEKGDARTILIQYFNQFSDKYSHYSVKTYDKQADKKSFHVIEFNPIAKLANAIDIESCDAEDKLALISLFQNIYTPLEEIQEGMAYSLQDFSHRILEIDAPDSTLVYNWVADIYQTTKSDYLKPQLIINGLMDKSPISEELLKSLFSSPLRKKYVESYLQRRKASIDDLALSIRLMTNELRGLKSSVTQKTKSFDLLKENLENEKTKFQNLSDQKFKKTEEVAEIQHKMNDCMDQITNLSDERSVISNKMAKMGPQVDDSKTGILYVDNETGENLINKLNEIDSKVSHLKTEHDKLSASLEKNKNDIVIIDNELSISSSTLDKLRTKHDNLSKQLNSLEAQINDIDMRKENLSIMKVKLEEDYRDLEKKFKSYKNITF